MSQQKREFTQRTKDASNESFISLMKQAKQAERYVIGCLLCESSAIMRVAEILQPEHFSDQAMACAYSTIKGVWENGVAPDMMNVTAAVIQDGKMDILSPVDIAQLASGVGSTTNLEEHAMFVRQCYSRRQLADGGMMIHQLGLDTTEDIGDQVAKSLKTIEGILSGMDYQNPMLDMGETTRKALKEYELKAERLANGTPYGLKSGLHTLDKFIHGFKPGELIVVGARPAMGKTALLLKFARSIAETGQVMAIFSLEMSDVSLTNRLILSYAEDMDADAYKDGRLDDQGKAKLFDAVEMVQRLPLMVDETPNLSIHQIKVRALNLKRKKGLSAIGIDYLQLMNMRSGNSSYNREQEISQTTRQLKQLAKELGVPIILLSQLNRNIETKMEGNEKTTALPRLSDLRESGAIEQDADVVLLIHRPEYYEDTDAEKGIGVIVIAKQRDGKTGKVRFKYSEDLNKITDVDSPLPF